MAEFVRGRRMTSVAQLAREFKLTLSQAKQSVTALTLALANAPVLMKPVIPKIECIIHNAMWPECCHSSKAAPLVVSNCQWCKGTKKVLGLNEVYECKEC